MGEPGKAVLALVVQLRQCGLGEFGDQRRRDVAVALDECDEGLDEPAIGERRRADGTEHRTVAPFALEAPDDRRGEFEDREVEFAEESLGEHELRPLATGYGAGTRDPEQGPANLVRVVLGESVAVAANKHLGEAWLLECNLDDVSGEELADEPQLEEETTLAALTNEDVDDREDVVAEEEEDAYDDEELEVDAEYEEDEEEVEDELDEEEYDEEEEEVAELEEDEEDAEEEDVDSELDEDEEYEYEYVYEDADEEEVEAEAEAADEEWDDEYEESA